MEIPIIVPSDLLDKGTARVRLPHHLIGSFKLGELALVYVWSMPSVVYLCTAWPSVTSGSCSADFFISFPVTPNAPIRSTQAKSSTIEASIFKAADWHLFQGHGETTPTKFDRVEAEEIRVRFFGDATKNSLTLTKRLQVRSLLESKFIAEKCVVAKEVTGGIEIVEARPASPNGLPHCMKITSSTVVQFASLAETMAIRYASSGDDSSLDKVVGGMANAKEALIDLLSLPLKYEASLKRLGTSVPRGILLHGPPGVGKTLLVKEAAKSLGVPVIAVAASDIFNPVLGQSELILRQIFERAEQMMGSSSHSSLVEGTLSLTSSNTNKENGSKSSASGDIGESSETGRFGKMDRYTIGGHSAGGVIIFIDEIDAICSRRDSGDGSGTGGHLEARIVAQLLTLLEQSRAIVVAATNRPNALDPALRRPGRFDREIEIPLPSVLDRIDIMRTLLRQVKLHEPLLSSSSGGHNDKEALALKIGQQTQGWSGADLSSLMREAALHSLHRHSHTSGEEGGVGIEDFEAAMLKISPTSHRGWTMEVPKTTWNDIGGLEEVKTKLKMMVEWPVTHADAFARLNVEIPKGVLLYGPPGCAKTTLVRAVANACKASFVCLSGADVYSPLLGESERKIREVFKKARAARPAIIFFDEIDAMVCKRGGSSTGGGDAVSTRVLTQLLTEMDGIESSGPLSSSSSSPSSSAASSSASSPSSSSLVSKKEVSRPSALNDHVIVMAATNRPDQLDEALLRPGRFDRIIEIPLPDEATRLAIFKVHSAKIPLGPSPSEVHNGLQRLSQDSKGLSGADIQAICREAAILALKRDINSEVVLIEDLTAAASKHGTGYV